MKTTKRTRKKCKATPITLIYRQNSFLDAIATEIENNGVQIKSITIPQGAKELPDRVAEQIGTALQQNQDRATKIYRDETMRLLYNEHGEKQKCEKYEFERCKKIIDNMSLFGQEMLFTQKSYEAVIKLIGKDMKAHSLDEAIVVLGVQYFHDTKGMLYPKGTIFDHDFNFEESNHLNSSQEDFIPLLERESAEIRRLFHSAYHFIENNLAENNIKAIPGIAIREESHGKKNFRIHGFEKVEDLTINDGYISEFSGKKIFELSLQGRVITAPSNEHQAVIIDRHATPGGLGLRRSDTWFNRSYIKHEGPIFAACDKESGNYHYCDCGNPGRTILHPLYENKTAISNIAKSIIANALK